ncbi:hypothetical protein NQ318_007276 [Aromia moschata]|uniref:Uncharacterized protein n=1 Tax=Aromia moschata TaxID=1265417 RepID=A0AAV8Z0P8_9CUCU|nr:hypothetical protein NQ318_007276 [Aromia moschata]
MFNLLNLKRKERLLVILVRFFHSLFDVNLRPAWDHESEIRFIVRRRETALTLRRKAILDLDPYNNDPKVIKTECVGHVEKRMGTRLHNAKKTNKGFGGRDPGKLTIKVTGELTTYYGLLLIIQPCLLRYLLKEDYDTRVIDAYLLNACLFQAPDINL